MGEEMQWRGGETAGSLREEKGKGREGNVSLP